MTQFLTHLLRFVKRSRERVPAKELKSTAPRGASHSDSRVGDLAPRTGWLDSPKSRLAGLAPWAILGFFSLYVLEAMFRPGRSPEGFDLAGFGRLPVLMNGRVQPLDSVARNSLLQIRSTASVPLEKKRAWQFWKHPRKLKPTEWLLEVMTRPSVADGRKVFLIHHPDLLGELELKAGSGPGLNYYSFKELEPKLNEIDNQAQRISNLPAGGRSTWERQLMKLQNAVVIFQRLKDSLQPNTAWQHHTRNQPAGYDFAARLVDFERRLPAAMAAARSRQQGNPFDETAFGSVVEFVRPFESVARSALPLAVPPLDRGKSLNEWESIGGSLFESLRSGKAHPALAYFARISTAFEQGEPADFNQAIAEYRQWLRGQGFEPELSKGGREFLFNQFQPFVKATALYLVGFLFGCTYWFRGSRVLYRSAALLVAFAFLLHTSGLLFRMVLEGRPPVTNLYSSSIFVGWAAALLGLVIEWFYRNGMGVATAACVGLVTQLIAHNLALGGDTMEMMRAVLDNNFWLATHVIVITLGYSAMFVAGSMALSYLLLGSLTPWLSAESARTLDQAAYGTLCFATLFTFTGTVLGGIWADQSWGRFGGWDPKENGALLVVLWNALYLHVRWGNLMNEKAQMAMAVAGNIVTSFSWFGVNMLGVGLHSYGFIDSAFKWLALFMASQLAIISLAFLRRRYR